MLSASSQLVIASFPLPNLTKTLHKARWRCTLCARWLGSNASAPLKSSTASLSLPLFTLSSACKTQVWEQNYHQWLTLWWPWRMLTEELQFIPIPSPTKPLPRERAEKKKFTGLTLLLFLSKFFNPKYAFLSSLCSGSRRRPFWKCLQKKKIQIIYKNNN